MTEVTGTIPPEAAQKIAVTTALGLVERKSGLFLRQELFDAENNIITAWESGPIATEEKAQAYMQDVANQARAEGKMHVWCAEGVKRAN